MNILIIGKSGQLGRSIKEAISNNSSNNSFVFIGRGELDLSKRGSVVAFF